MERKRKGDAAGELVGRIAFGGSGWSARPADLSAELGTIWAPCGVASEWAPLRSVLMHRPGQELASVGDPDASLMLERPEPARAGVQHDTLCETYRKAGVSVHHVDTPAGGAVPANLMFQADLFFMTPQGAVLARPASPVRAGEERLVAAALARLGFPILMSVHGGGTFEGADAMWLAPDRVLIAVGLRTNAEGARQVAGVLADLGVDSVVAAIPTPPMHLMGALRITDAATALTWPGQVGTDVTGALTEAGFHVHALPSVDEIARGAALNFVTLEPGHIVMPAGNPKTQAFYVDLGIRCETVAVDEIYKAAGGIGCLTGILWRSEEAKA